MPKPETTGPWWEQELAALILERIGRDDFAKVLKIVEETIREHERMASDGR
jgi:hypothetical protein